MLNGPKYPKGLASIQSNVHTAVTHTCRKAATTRLPYKLLALSFVLF